MNVCVQLFMIVYLFRWRETADGHWTGVMRGKVWTLTQTEDTLWYYVYNHQKNPGTENRQKQKVEEEEQLLGKRSKRMIDMKQEEAGMCTVMSEPDIKEEELLRDYFQLGVKLGDLYRDWSTADPHFKHTANIFTGTYLINGIVHPKMKIRSEFTHPHVMLRSVQ